MSYLEENYLGDPLVAPMSLPTELMNTIRRDTLPLGANDPLPADYLRLPGGIIMKKSTALLLGVLITVVVLWYLKKHKKTRR